MPREGRVSWPRPGGGPCEGSRLDLTLDEAQGSACPPQAEPGSAGGMQTTGPGLKQASSSLSHDRPCPPPLSWVS